MDQAIEDFDTPLDKMSSKELIDFVKAHIVKGKMFIQDLVEHKRLKNLNGGVLHIEYNNAKLKINQSHVLFMNKEALNGMIHYIYPASSTSNESL